jgi:tellurium resistance protein TerD
MSDQTGLAVTTLSTVKVVEGQKLDLSKAVAATGEATLTKIRVELGWDEPANGSQFDADASVIFAGDDEKALAQNVLYYGTPKVNDVLSILGGAAIHSGDNLTGQGDGPDETITIDLSAVPATETKALIYVTIHEADSRNQNFGMVNNAFVQVVNDANNEILAKFELDFDADTATSLRFGHLFKRNDSWYFQAEKKEVTGGLGGIFATHGV